MNRADAQQLEKISNALSWRFALAVKDHFNKAGQLETFANAVTPDEEKKQQQYGFALTFAEDELPLMKIHDVFAAVARRVANDDKALAALLPEKLDAADAVLLEKYELNALAALLRTKLAA